MLVANSNPAHTNATRTKIDDISLVGTTLSDAEIRLVSGGGGETSTADNNTCDMDGTPTPRPTGRGFGFSDLLVSSYQIGGSY